MVRTCVTWDVLLVLLNPPQDLTSCRAEARPGHPISGLMHCSKRYCDLVDHLVGALLLGSQFSQRERGKLTCEYPRAASGATDRAWAACRHFSASPPIQTNRTRIPHIPSMIT